MRRTRNTDHGRGPGSASNGLGNKAARPTTSKDGSYLKTWGSRPASKLKRWEAAA